MNRDSNTTELYTIIDRAIDEAMLNNRFMFKMYDYLRLGKWTRRDTNEFIESASAAQLSNLVEELDAYIKGGDKQLREAYGHIPKPKARKIKDYLYAMLDDAWTYYADRKPGRKKKSVTK